MPIIGQISVGDGATFTPAVDNDGVISWSNDKNLPNPASVDIPQVVMDRYQIAPIASPAFTGNPTAPTQAKTDNSTKLATTAYVKAVVADYLELTGGSITGDVDITGDLSVSGAITGDLTGSVTGNVTGTASGNLPLTGGTMTGSIEYVNNGKVFAIGNTTTGNVDLGWNWDNREGAGIGLRSTDYSNPGEFTLFARDSANSCSLLGKPNGDLTWDGHNVLTDGFVGNIVSNSAGDKSVPTSTSVTVTTVSLSKGVWVVTGHVFFEGISGHNYGAQVVDSQYFTYAIDGAVSVAPGSNQSIALQPTRIFNLQSTTTIYLNVYTTGGTATAKANLITAVRIA